MKISDFTAKEIEANFRFEQDAHGESFDRFVGRLVSKTDPTFTLRVKIFKKDGSVRASFCNKDHIYCDPKLSSGRAKAVLALQAQTLIVS